MCLRRVGLLGVGLGLRRQQERLGGLLAAVAQVGLGARRLGRGKPLSRSSAAF